MTITAKVIAHSAAPDAPDLITLQLRYPRFIHAEFMTHRVFSRNASSSRAVPIERMIQDVLDDPAMPVSWGSNKPGMQAGDELPHCEIARDCWLDAKDAAVQRAKEMMNLGAHKQIANRLLEPFGHISVVVTATEWDNFFKLRRHEAADPTMRALADAMYEAIQGSTPKVTADVSSSSIIAHAPYVGEDAWDYAFNNMHDAHPLLTVGKVSAARCARVSYLNHDGSTPDIKRDLALADKLLAMGHMSPFEHQAQWFGSQNPPEWQGNLRIWSQFRRMIETNWTHA